MTVGQRIAQKRKEQGLSQEGLGEQLGVSRQAIYKWESDASLPEIEKLITLSKIFSVSIGWLLGVEEEGPEALTQEQERLIEDVLSRYQAPKRSGWSKWSVPVLFAMCGITLALVIWVGVRMREMDRRLSGSINSITWSVDSQISAATNQMKQAMAEQADLLADWSVNLVSTDSRTNTATFRVRATPKTFTEGMTALFSAQNGMETVEVPVEAGTGHTFSGEVSCPLSDKITLTVSFLADGVGQTQVLKAYWDLYTESFPDAHVGSRHSATYKDHIMPAKDLKITVTALDGEQIPSLRVGLFRDRKLVQWCEPDTYTESVSGIVTKFPDPIPCWTIPQDVDLESGIYYAAAFYTDEYGREYVYFNDLFLYDRNTSELFHGGIDVDVLPTHDSYSWEF